MLNDILFSMGQDYITLVVFSFFISLFFYILLFFVGKLLMVEGIVLRAKIGFERWVAALFLFFVLFGFKSLFDGVVNNYITSQGIDRDLSIVCGNNCLIDVAEAVVKKYIDILSSNIESSLKKIPSFGVNQLGVDFDTILAAYSGFSYSLNYRYSFESDKALKETSYYKIALSYLAVIYVFLRDYALNLGMFFFLLGLALKPLYFLDRAASTMIALGITLLYAFPFLIVFFLSPSTVNVSYTPSSCPSACESSIVGFSQSSILTEDKLFSSRDDALDFYEGNVEEIEIDGETYTSCSYKAKEIASTLSNYGPNLTYDEKVCPYECRIIPFPNLPNCRKAELSCRILFDNYPQCFSFLNSSIHLNKSVIYNNNVVKLREALSAAECFTIPPSLPLDKPNYPFPIPEGCRYFKIYSSNGGYKISLADSCVVYDFLPQDVKNYIDSKKPSDVNSFLSELKSNISTGNVPLLEFGVVVRENCEEIEGISVKDIKVIKSIDCSSCFSYSFKESSGDILALSMLGSAFSLGSSIMFLISLSMSLSGFMFIPALSKLL